MGLLDGKTNIYDSNALYELINKYTNDESFTKKLINLHKKLISDHNEPKLGI